jgi:hypothetical protein
MAWFWDAYLPEKDKRDEVTASPLRATVQTAATSGAIEQAIHVLRKALGRY